MIHRQQLGLRPQALRESATHMLRAAVEEGAGWLSDDRLGMSVAFLAGAQ